MAKIIIAGDFCPKERVQEHIEAQNFENIFGDVKKYTSKADYSIVNLEAPIVNGTAYPISKCGPSLKAIPATADAILYAGFNLVTLANNHFNDYGDSGVFDTINACKEAEIDTVGGVNIAEASKTLYKVLKGVTIGNNSVVGMSSMLTRDIPANTINAGIPSRTVRNDINWSKELITI